MSLLISAAKSTQVSREIIDYTLVAQNEIEMVYQLAQETLKSEHQKILVEELEYSITAEEGTKVIYEKTTEQVFIQLTVSDYEDNSLLNKTLSHLKIAVMPLESSQGGAQIESIIEWGRDYE